jgi:hypothetical protein
MPSDFQVYPGERVQTHNAVVVAASGTSSKRVAFKSACARGVSVYWKITGTGTPRLRLYAWDLAGNRLQQGADQVATSGVLDLSANRAVGEIEVEVVETGAAQSITVTAEVATSP